MSFPAESPLLSGFFNSTVTRFEESIVTAPFPSCEASTEISEPIERDVAIAVCGVTVVSKESPIRVCLHASSSAEKKRHPWITGVCCEPNCHVQVCSILFCPDFSRSLRVNGNVVIVTCIVPLTSNCSVNCCIIYCV